MKNLISLWVWVLLSFVSVGFEALGAQAPQAILRIEEVRVNFGPPFLITIRGQNFNNGSPTPTVFLGAGNGTTNNITSRCISNFGTSPQQIVCTLATGLAANTDY